MVPLSQGRLPRGIRYHAPLAVRVDTESGACVRVRVGKGNAGEAEDASKGASEGEGEGGEG